MKQTILITGAAKRIGNGLVKRFAKDYNIIIHYHTSAVEANLLSDNINIMGGNAHPVYADLRNENDIINMFQAGIEYFGQIDILINNAATFPEKRAVGELSLIEWNDIMNINLNSQFLTCREFTKQHIKQGRIVNISSLGGIKIWNKQIAYNISKSAVIQLTKVLAKDLAPKISVNCICPGVVQINENEQLPIHLSNIPMQRYANIDDIFDAVKFFVSRTNYITGQMLCVDGGMSVVN